jgi:hypothetical protein
MTPRADIHHEWHVVQIEQVPAGDRPGLEHTVEFHAGDRSADGLPRARGSRSARDSTV